MDVLKSLSTMSPVWVGLWVYGLTVASAIVPWINAEIIVLSLPAFATSREALFVLLLIATAGQMTGKCAVYWAGAGSGRVLPARIAAAVASWRDRLAARPIKAAALVFVSSTFGLPPFYLMSLVAGALRMNFPLFLTVGTVGRLLRFGTLVLIPHLVLPWFRH